MKKNLLRKVMSALMALTLVMALPAQVLAADWYLENGSVTVSHDGTNQTVTQNATTQADSNPVITQKDPSVATSNTITVSTSGGGEADFTIKDVNIVSDAPAIDVGNSSATIHVEGDNHVTNTDGSVSPVHVSSGDLTITSDSGGSLTSDGAGHAAGIGSNEDEDMSGNITINGDVTVYSETSNDGAGIGSGNGNSEDDTGDGAMSGTILIEGDANVTAISGDDGAGIGSGDDDGDMSGDIIIRGNAIVHAESDDDGAGIGAGEDNEMSGSILIEGDALVYVETNDDSAGIGAGDDSPMSGDVTIGGDANVIIRSDGAGIGSGDAEDMSGNILIRDSAFVDIISSDGTGIGAGDYGAMSGTVTITDDATVIAVSESQAGIGGAFESPVSGTITISGNANVIAVGDEGNASIGADNTGHMTDTALIQILDNANVLALEYVYTDEDGFYRYGIIGDVIGEEYPAKPDRNAPGRFEISTSAYINGIPGSDVDNLTRIFSFRLDKDGKPVNLTLIENEGAEAQPTRAAFQVLDQDGNRIPYKAVIKEGVLTVTVEKEYAIFVTDSIGLSALEIQGITDIVFKTKSAESKIVIADELKILEDNKLTLIHDGKKTEKKTVED